MNRPASSGTVIIRADGSKVIGMGHLSRISHIVGAFQKKGIAAKVILKEDADAKRFLSQRNVPFECLPADIPLSSELQKLRELVISASANIFILDVLNYDDYFDFLKSLKASHCSTVVIYDETQKKKLESDIILNGNPCQLEHDYRDYPGRYLVGPRYFIMDANYQKTATSMPKKAPKNILVTVGGADHNDLLFKVLGALAALKGPYHAKIFSTSATGYLDRLKKWLAGSRLSHELFVDEKTLVPFWSDCDVAITAGGNTLFERIATHLPGATLCQLDLQMKIADAFENMGVNVNLGHGLKLNEKDLFNRLEVFLNDLDTQKSQHAKSAGVVDGRGLDYLMEAIHELR